MLQSVTFNRIRGIHEPMRKTVSISGWKCRIFSMNGRTLVLIFALSLLAGSAHGATLIGIESGMADGSYLPVKVSGIASATSLQFDLTYDPAVVSISGIRRAAGYEGVSMTTNTNAPGTARVLVIFPDPVTIQEPSGVVEVAFSSAAAGTSALALADARWSDFPAFASIIFDDVAGGTIESTTAPGATPVATPTGQPVTSYWEPGAFQRPDDPVAIPDIPVAPVSTAIPATPLTPAVPVTPAVPSVPLEPGDLPAEPAAPVATDPPEPTPAPAPLAVLPLLCLMFLIWLKK